MVYQITYQTGECWNDSCCDCDLAEVVKDYGKWMRVHESEWFIETSQTSAQVHANLWQHTGPNDRLIVTRIHRDWVVSGLSTAQIQWLQQRNYTSLAEILAGLFAPKFIPLPKPLPPLPVKPLLRGLLGS